MTFEEIMLKSFELSEKETARIQRTMIKDYNIALKKINAQIKDVYAVILSGVEPSEYFNIMTKYNRLVKLQLSISQEYAKLARQTKIKMVENSEIAFSNTYYRQMYSINWTQINTIFTPVNADVLAVSVYGTPRVWNSLAEQFGDMTDYIPKSGTLLEQLLAKNNAKTIADLQQKLRAGLITGDSYTKVAREIREVMGNSVNNSLRIARTEGHRNMSAGNYAQTEYAREEGVEAKRMIVSALDLKTRPQSVQVDGKFENEDGFFVYPGGKLVKFPGNSGVAAWDINDREAVITTVDGVPPETRRARDPVKEKRWDAATAAEKKNRKLSDGTEIFPRSEQTDIISFKSMPEWMEDNGLKFNKSGKMVEK